MSLSIAICLFISSSREYGTFYGSLLLKSRQKLLRLLTKRLASCYNLALFDWFILILITHLGDHIAIKGDWLIFERLSLFGLVWAFSKWSPFAIRKVSFILFPFVTCIIGRVCLRFSDWGWLSRLEIKWKFIQREVGIRWMLKLWKELISKHIPEINAKTFVKLEVPDNENNSGWLKRYNPR